MENENIIFNAFKPVYYFSKLVGFMPLTYKSKNSNKNKTMHTNMSLVWSWLSVVYSGLWLALMITFRFLIMKPPPSRPMEGFGNFSVTNSTIVTPDPPSFANLIGWNMMLDSTSNLFIIITGVYGLWKLPAIFRQFQLMDNYVDEDGYLIENVDQRNLITRGKIFGIFMVILGVLYTFLSTLCGSSVALYLGISIIQIARRVFQDLLKLGYSAGEIQFLTLCYFIYQRFKMLNDNLVSLRTSMCLIVNKLRTKTLHQMWSPAITNISGKILPYSPLTIPLNDLSNNNGMKQNITSMKDNVADNLNRLSKWHRHLCDVIDSISSCYGLTLIVSIAYCFASSVIGIYTSATRFDKHRPLMEMPQIIWTACFGCRMILLTVIPSFTISEAIRSRLLVDRLNNRSLDINSKEEIAIFISHLSSRNISFTICGFFTLNIQFLRSIAVAIVTYVILLIQFKVK